LNRYEKINRIRVTFTCNCGIEVQEFEPNLFNQLIAPNYSKWFEQTDFIAKANNPCPKCLMINPKYKKLEMDIKRIVNIETWQIETTAS
jgi:hypothetical protein